MKWYRLAATGEDSRAQYNLGWLFANGKGVAQNLVCAHMWLNEAANRGYSDAARFRDAISKLMTPQQIAEAQTLARKCETSKYRDCD
jgi:uncharacterized protein